MKITKYLQLLLLAGCAVLFRNDGKAQALVPPFVPQTFVANVTTTAGGTPTPSWDDVEVNCDMLRHGLVGEPIKAIVWDEGFLSRQGHVYFEDYNGNKVILPINGWRPDVVLGDDPNNPGIDYRAAVVYIAASTLTPRINFYHLQNFGSPSFSATLTGSAPLSTVPISGPPFSNLMSVPHIDMWSNAGNLIYGYPAMEEFAVTWTEGNNVYCNWGNIAAGTLYVPMSNPARKLTGSNNNKHTDVACYTHMATGTKYAAFSHINGTFGLMVTEVDFSTNPLPAALPFPYTFGTNGIIPRIEAMSQYAGAGSGAKWNVVVSRFSSCYSFNDVTGGTDISTTLLSGGDFKSTAVAAGVGNQPGGTSYIGDVQYTAGYFEWQQSIGPPLPPPSYYAREVNAATGAVLNPNYYIINTLQVWGMPGYHLADASVGLALSNCSNSGQYILSAWHDGDTMGTTKSIGSIWYKLSSGSSPMYFRTTTAADVTGSPSASLYPNPASDKIYLSNGLGAYTIYNLSGIKAARGNIKQGESIPVYQLSPGLYLLKTEDGRVYKFTKE